MEVTTKRDGGFLSLGKRFVFDVTSYQVSICLQWKQGIVTFKEMALNNTPGGVHKVIKNKIIMVQ